MILRLSFVKVLSFGVVGDTLRLIEACGPRNGLFLVTLWSMGSRGSLKQQAMYGMEFDSTGTASRSTKIDQVIDYD